MSTVACALTLKSVKNAIARSLRTPFRRMTTRIPFTKQSLITTPITALKNSVHRRARQAAHESACSAQMAPKANRTTWMTTYCLQRYQLLMHRMRKELIQNMCQCQGQPSKQRRRASQGFKAMIKTQLQQIETGMPTKSCLTPSGRRSTSAIQ